MSNIVKYTFKFGKYAEQTLDQVFDKDKQYCDWFYKLNKSYEKQKKPKYPFDIIYDEHYKWLVNQEKDNPKLLRYGKQDLVLPPEEEIFELSQQEQIVYLIKNAFDSSDNYYLDKISKKVLSVIEDKKANDEKHYDQVKHIVEQTADIFTYTDHKRVQEIMDKMKNKIDNLSKKNKSKE